MSAQTLSIVIDAIVILAILVFAFMGASKGFFKGLIGFIGLGLSLLVAYFLAAPTEGIMEIGFSSTTAITNGLRGYFDGLEGFTTVVEDGQLQESIVTAMQQGLNVPEFLATFIWNKVLITVTGYAGLTVSEILSTVFAKIIMELICGTVIFFVMLIAISIITKIFTDLINKVSMLGYFNTVLGLLLGALKGVIVVMMVAAILTFIPAENVQNIVSQTTVFSALSQTTVQILSFIQL